MDGPSMDALRTLTCTGNDFAYPTAQRTWHCSSVRFINSTGEFIDHHIGSVQAATTEPPRKTPLFCLARCYHDFQSNSLAADDESEAKETGRVSPGRVDLPIRVRGRALIPASTCRLHRSLC